MEKEVIQRIALKLIAAHKQGLLGGEKMPEDESPGFSISSKENYLYFTLPMALNYQRDSYKLWEAANKTFQDDQTRDVFVPEKVIGMSKEDLQKKLVKYKVALQPNKQPEIWRRFCETFVSHFAGDVRVLISNEEDSIMSIKKYMLSHKKDFPYLSGAKIMNYWLYVLSAYTDAEFVDRENISVAPDTHVLKASLKIGVINENEYKQSNVQALVAKRWEEIMKGIGMSAIDIHTPLWLWSRSGFKMFIE